MEYTNRRKNTHHGGFSTSICDLFNHPNSRRRKSDCCALVWCGIFLSDRNRHLLITESEQHHEENQTSVMRSSSLIMWTKRIIINVIFPTVVFIVMIVLKNSIAPNDDEAVQGQWLLLILIVMLVISIFLCLRGKYSRISERRKTLELMYRDKYGDTATNTTTTQQLPSGEASENNVCHATLEKYLKNQGRYNSAVHALCSCVKNDTVTQLRDDQNEEENITTGTSDLQIEEDDKEVDLCTLVWRLLSQLCCNWCCGCWLVCCGMCAIAQEDREIQRLVPSERLLIDYVSFQPYSDYYHKILHLRQGAIKPFMYHLKALSKLSTTMLRIFGLSLLVLLIIAIPSHFSEKFSLLNVLLVLAAFFEAFFILHFVHWRWNRFDLSFDAIIKYFSSGFVICTSLALVYEMAISLFLGIFLQIIVVIGISIDIEKEEATADNGAPLTDSQMSQLAKKFAADHPIIFGVFVFLNAFLVAALVEEIVKYFGYWIIEHPDLIINDPTDDDNETDIIPLIMRYYEATEDATSTVNCGNTKHSTGSVENESSLGPVIYVDDDKDFIYDDDNAVGTNGEQQGSGGSQNTPSPPTTTTSGSNFNNRHKQQRSLRSIGSGITIAMVATALGFACCENLIYVFIYTPPSVSNRLATLVARCLFPVHPLTAAIQSIGVVRRDLEGDKKKVGIGKIILPALLLHGGFDFALMFYAFMIGLESNDGGGDGGEATSTTTNNGTSKNEVDNIPVDESSALQELRDQLPVIVISVCIVFFGFIYYVCQATRQRKRLACLELAQENDFLM